MYYIYEIAKDRKVGVTNNTDRRFKEHKIRLSKKGISLSEEEMVELEQCTTIEEATRRERELQLEKGYSTDAWSYSHSVNNNRTVCHTPEAIKKRVNNRDYSKHSELQKGKIQPQFVTKEAIKKAAKNREKKVAAYTQAGALYKVWDSVGDAGKELNVKRGQLYDTIAGRQKTCRGFVWKYLEK